MRRFCQEMMKDNKGDYIFVGDFDGIEDNIRMVKANDGEKTVELS